MADKDYDARSRVLQEAPEELVLPHQKGPNYVSCAVDGAIATFPLAGSPRVSVTFYQEVVEPVEERLVKRGVADHGDSIYVGYRQAKDGIKTVSAREDLVRLTMTEETAIATVRMLAKRLGYHVEADPDAESHELPSEFEELPE